MERAASRAGRTTSTASASALVLPRRHTQPLRPHRRTTPEGTSRWIGRSASSEHCTPPAWPGELSPTFGGHGLPAAYETAWREEAGRFPLMTEQLSITLGNCLPTLLEFGTDAQRCRHVPRILAGREVWCQLFSEPAAGSDIAGVQTRAVAVSGGWLVNGQKVWTTLAHRADFGLLLARTDPSAAKHAGLSMLIIDLAAAGVEVRPIRQLDGAMHFDEVFLTDVFVPSDAVLPPAGAGGASRRRCCTTSASLVPPVNVAGCATTARIVSATSAGAVRSPSPWSVTASCACTSPRSARACSSPGRCRPP